MRHGTAPLNNSYTNIIINGREKIALEEYAERVGLHIDKAISHPARDFTLFCSVYPGKR
jgi:hypothetical protein